MTSVRLFISFAAVYNWLLHQLDIKNAFFHSNLQKEVYMEQQTQVVAPYILLLGDRHEEMHF